jgi:predicted phage terminase large subunit-like protein
VADEQEASREELRTKCRASNYFLAKAVLGFDKLTLRTHLPLCEFLEAQPRRALVLAPRSTFKSTIGTITDIIRLILCRPDVRILLVSISQDNAKTMLSMVKAQFERNATLQWLFPELMPDFRNVRWNETEMEVKRDRDWPEPTVQAIGTSSTVVSRHYDVIKNDDLVDEKTKDSPTELARALEFYKLEESLLVSPLDGVIQTIGTRWAFGDPYGWMLAHEAGLLTYRRGPVNDDGTLYFPEQLPQEELDRLRAKYGSYLYSCLYDNDPRDPDAGSFRESWLKKHRVEGDVVVPAMGSPIPLVSMRRFMRVDPAISESSNAARTAIVVDGVAPDGRKFLLETWAKRCQPSEMFEAIFALQSRWDCEAIGIEAVAYQRAIKPFLMAEAERRGRWLNVVEMRPDTRKSKEARIRSTQPFLERGEVSVREEHHDFLMEYREFPYGKTVDLLDAWAYGTVMWELPLDEAEDETVVEDWHWSAQFEGRSHATGY